MRQGMLRQQHIVAAATRSLNDTRLLVDNQNDAFCVKWIASPSLIRFLSALFAA
jgi:hypothetical protein